MADQDFNIKVVTTADTTGLKQTRAEMEALRQQSEKIKQDAGAAALFARIPPGGTPPVPGGGVGGSAGLTGTAVGIGTIVTLLTVAINKWKAFNDELDRSVDKMIQSEEKMRALGESIIDMQDKARNAARTATEPLEQSFIRLQQEIIRIKTEMSGLLESGQFEAWKKLNADLGVTQSQLNGVTAALQRQEAAAKKAAQTELEKRVPGLKAEDQIKEADAQTKAILMNEQAAAKARSEGRDRDADMFDKSAELYKKSATPAQLADLQRIHDLQDKLKPPAPPIPRQPNPGEPGGGEVGTGGPSLIGEEARKSREAEAEANKGTLVHQEDVEFVRKQGLLRTAHASKQAAKEREASNERLRGENRAGEIERQTQDSNRERQGSQVGVHDNKGIEAKLDILIGIWR